MMLPSIFLFNLAIIKRKVSMIKIEKVSGKKSYNKFVHVVENFIFVDVDSRLMQQSKNNEIYVSDVNLAVEVD